MKNIVWDWNGTLLNDRELCLNILNTMLKKRGLPVVSEERYLDIFTFPIIEYYREAGFDFAREPYPLLADEFMKLYDEREPSVGLFPGAEEILSFFKNCGIRQYVLSTTREQELLLQIGSRGIRDYFKEIRGTDTILAHGKRETAKKWAEEHKDELGESVFIGDTLHDREVAEIMGIDCIFFSQGHMSRKRLENAGIKIADTYEDLKKWIGQSK